MKAVCMSLLLMGMTLGASAADFNSPPRTAAFDELNGANSAGLTGEIAAPDTPKRSKVAVRSGSVPRKAAWETGGGDPGNNAEAGADLPTEREISDAVNAQGFDLDNIGIAITYFSPSGRQVTYQYNSDAWWYPASTTKVVVLTYVYHYAYIHRKPGEDFNSGIIAEEESYISKMVRASDNDSTTHLANKYGEDNIQAFSKRVLGYDGIETGWKKLSGPDRVTARGMNLLLSYIYDDRNTEAIPLPVKKEIRRWLELPKIGQLDIQNKPILDFLNNPDMPDPYDRQSGLTVGMKGGWTDDVGSGYVSCFNWQKKGSRWTAAIYRRGNWAYFGKIGGLYRDLFLLFKDKR